MRRLLRWSFNLSALLSAVLFVGVCVLWVRSYRTAAVRELWWERQRWALHSTGGRVRLSKEPQRRAVEKRKAEMIDRALGDLLDASEALAEGGHHAAEGRKAERLRQALDTRLRANKVLGHGDDHYSLSRDRRYSADLEKREGELAEHYYSVGRPKLQAAFKALAAARAVPVPAGVERSIPDAVLAAVSALPLAALAGTSLARACARGRRRRQCRCVHCGYDLRATPGRCPECGAVPPSKVPA